MRGGEGIIQAPREKLARNISYPPFPARVSQNRVKMRAFYSSSLDLYFSSIRRAAWDICFCVIVLIEARRAGWKCMALLKYSGKHAKIFLLCFSFACLYWTSLKIHFYGGCQRLRYRLPKISRCDFFSREIDATGFFVTIFLFFVIYDMMQKIQQVSTNLNSINLSR